MARPCEARHPDPHRTAANCRLCWLATNDGRYQRSWGLPVTAPDGPFHQGPPTKTSRVRWCAARGVWDWSVTRGGDTLAHGSEKTEAEAWREARAAFGGEPPRIVATLDETNLAPGLPGRRFNSSLTPYRDGYLIAFRTGWAGSEIGLATLGRDLRPTGWSRLLTDLRHPAANYGREDPRLWWYRGDLHLLFTGVIGSNGPTNVLYARLRDDLTVEAVFHPAGYPRQAWEKNHTAFEYGGDLYAVYGIRPHRILRVVNDTAAVAYTTDAPLRWSGGHLRGGAPPVFHAGRWWHWFHGRTGPDAAPTYNVGVYCFEPRPPFRITHITPDPIHVADWGSANRDGNYAAVFFVASATPEGDSWLVCGGHNDRRTQLLRFDAAHVEAELVAV